MDDYELYKGMVQEWTNYMYLKDAPLWYFGYGLSYTKFEYSNLRLNADKLTPQRYSRCEC